MINQQNYPYNYGYTYGVQRPQARNTQPLTPEQIATLRRDTNGFDMKVEQEDIWRARCTHKEKNGQSTLISNEDGSYTCTICHETFNMSDASRKEIEDIVSRMIDVLQTSKTIYLDAPDELVNQYYQIIPLLKKFPELWERSMKNFSMYEGANFNSVNPMSPGYSGFAALNNLIMNPYAAYNTQAQYAQQPYGYPQQPYGYPQQQPMPMNYQPMMDPNPMAYATAPTAPVPGVMPTNPQPNANVTPAAPAQPEVQQQQVFNV